LQSRNLADCDQNASQSISCPSFLAFTGHMPLGKQFCFGRLGILFGTEISLLVCDEAEICGDDFSCL
jgi:hypothetical protein